jgi:hypothetical protein
MPWPRRSAAQSRTVEVVSPSHGGEAGWVLIAAGYIVLCMIYVYAFGREGPHAVDAARGTSTLLPYQVLFRDLPNEEQRTFRDMQEGSLEALRLRGETGSWPNVAALAAAGIPPFAPDVLDKQKLRWVDRRDGLFVDYLGVPSASEGATAFLILVQEPDPVTGEKPPPPSVVDEEHRLLPDGRLLHVTFWKRSAAGVDAGTIVDPALQGWQQIRLKTLFEEMEQR